MSEAYKSPEPQVSRELRAQGKRTRQRLLSAATDVFAERGYHSARVDDIVRAARTSHGTFYLYFANKQEVLLALAVECAQELQLLVDELAVVADGGAQADSVGEWLQRFIAVYGEFGPIIRAWMENQVADRETNLLGVEVFTAIASGLAKCIRATGGDASPVAVGALMAMLERYSYFVASGRVSAPTPEESAAFIRTVYRGFFDITAIPA